ncbi:MAG TPA: DNA-formamidopyrimidine glycosylase family protein [Baekduia sp.]|nr:DNA-formamidopyrimidine glycosylase family protein [Baekduia sp.]
MPEGDTIHYAANRIRPVLAGRIPDEIRTPHPRFGRDRWPERLGGRAVESVEAHGKHLFLRFEGDLAIHSHLRMTGAWRVHPEGARWSRSPRRAWLVIRAQGQDVVQFDGPVLELLTETRRRFDLRLGALGPDVIADDFDERVFLRRLREDDPTRTIGDALLDQRTIAGIGNLWKAEGCWMAQVDPWRAAGEVSDEEALRIVREVRPPMQRSARDGHQARDKAVYGRAGRPCRRCDTPILQRGQGDDNRPTYWCPGCQS